MTPCFVCSQVPESRRSRRGHRGRVDARGVRPRRARRDDLRAECVFRTTERGVGREPVPPVARVDDFCGFRRPRRRSLVLRVGRNPRTIADEITQFSDDRSVEVRGARVGPGRLVSVVPPRRNERVARRARNFEMRRGGRGQSAAPLAGYVRAVHGLARVDVTVRHDEEGRERTRERRVG